MTKRPRDSDSYGQPCKSVVFGSDHAGYGLKKQLMDYMKESYKTISIHDVGTTSEANRVDYPDIAEAACSLVQRGSYSRAVLLDGAGVASGMAANKMRGIRAAVVHDHFSISMGRKHNDCNVICLGGKTLGIEAAKEILDVFIKCEFEGERHLPRLAKLVALGESQFAQGETLSSPRSVRFSLSATEEGRSSSSVVGSPFKLPQ